MGKQETVRAEVVIVASKADRDGYFNVKALQGAATAEAATFHMDNAERLHRFAKKANVDDSVVLQAIEKVLHADQVGSSPAPVGFSVKLRGMSQSTERGRTIEGNTPLAAIETALAVADYAALEPVIEWDGTDILAALDLDFHDLPVDKRPTPDRLEKLISRVRPRPILWWTTHGHGLRLIYTAMGGMTGAELAACAGLTLRSLELTATFEILARTRHPAYPRPDYPTAGPVRRESPTAEIGLLARWLARDVGKSCVEQWLTEHSLQPNRSYPHDRCPVDPTTSSHGDPVFVGDGGIFCHKCKATGLCLGSRRAGFFPWSALMGGGLSPRLRTAARYFCHWEHAQYIIADDIGLDGEMARLCYSALLKAMHGASDPRTREAMYRGRGLVRMDGYWATADLARSHKASGLVDRLEKLPAVLHLVRGTELIGNKERLGIFQGVDDLAQYGYCRVQPIRGMKLHGQFQPVDACVVRAVILPEYLRAPEMQAYRPRYLAAEKRMKLPEAKEILYESFPGIDFNFLQLLIAARACAEGCVGQAPRIAADGPTGAGKDMTVKIAAMLIGDTHQDVPWIPSVREFHMALNEASLCAGLVTSSEIIKLILAKKGDVRMSLSGMLNYDRGTSVRKLYVGPVRARLTTPIVITDTAFPRELHCDAQLGRRFVYVHLDHKVDWQTSAKNFEMWRTLRLENAAAANAIISHVIDEFFSGAEPMVFDEIARKLGFSHLNQAGNLGGDPADELLAVFDACLSAEAIVAPEGKWKGPGWCLVQRGAKDPVSVAWRNVCDNLIDGFTSSRRIKETDWAALLGAEAPVDCDISPNGGSTLAVRFRCGKERSPYAKYNANILRGTQIPDVIPQSAELAPDDALHAVLPTTPMQGTPASAPESPDVKPFHPFPDPTATGSRAVGSDPAPVFVDIMTRSACGPDEGGRRYAAHPSTEILSIVAKIDERIIVWTPTVAETLPEEKLLPIDANEKVGIDTFAGSALPAPLANAIAGGRSFCGHDALEFTARVWAAKGILSPAVWLDTLVEAHAAGLPETMDELGQVLFGVTRNKDADELKRRLCRPDQHGNFLPFTSQNVIRMVTQSISDVLLLARIYDVVRDHAEPEVVTLDRTINDRGISVDVALARALITLEAQDSNTACVEVEQITDGAIKAGDLHRDQHVLDWLRARGVELANMQNATVLQLLADHPELDAVVRRVLEVRLSVNRVATGKLERAVVACEDDGRLRDQFVYHGAHTGRWTGRGVQLHNLPRPHRELTNISQLIAAAGSLEKIRAALPLTITLADVISTLVRPCFRAAPGKKLIIGDFSAIEPRGLAWCAADVGSLNLFAGGTDTYCALATKLIGRPITKDDETERSVGKEAEIGCGYGLGPAAFGTRCIHNGVDLASVGLTPEAVVEGYRDAHPSIAGVKVVSGDRIRRQGGLWNDLELVASRAIHYVIYPYQAGRCEVSIDGYTLVIRLPSGRRLCYRNARIEQRVPGYCSALGLPDFETPTIVYDGPKEKGITTYGGKLTENIVQAICRDLLVAAMLQCEREGLPIVMHVHDEVVAEVPAELAEDSLRRLLTIMSTPPGWALGFPIEVKGYVAERYVKNPPKDALVMRARNGVLVD